MTALPRDCACVASGELGVALSGGGSRALAQLGVLKVLEREGISVSYVAGTSGGAVIGAVYALSPTALEAEERILTHLRTSGTGFNRGSRHRSRAPAFSCGPSGHGRRSLGDVACRHPSAGS